MLRILRIFTALLGVLAFASSTIVPLPQVQAIGSQRLFLNLTTDEMVKAAMGLSMANNVLDRGGQVTVFCNVRAVRLVSKAIPQNIHALSNETLQQKILSIIAKGGEVRVCQMCMKQFGVKTTDLIPGVLLSNPDFSSDAVTDPDTNVVVY